ncbi:MAG TPA: metal-dependent transcriptional regulator [Bryobacteraceae bacterium]|jgi:DtxR family Mn-dependent transcriptional regulator
MARKTSSESVDDYLKAILQLAGAEESPVATKALAERLEVRAPSVTEMLQKLASRQPPLILYGKRQGVALTPAGKRRAWELVRHHRLLELFLHDILKYSWDEVHEEAERLEHFISERFEDKVAAVLGYPEIDPHGHRIPAKREAGAYREEAALSEWPVEVPAVIASVSDKSAAALRELERLGLMPGIRLTVERRHSTNGLTVRLDAGRGVLRLRKGLASQILVTESARAKLA